MSELQATEDVEYFPQYQIGIQDGTLIIFVQGEATHQHAPSVRTAILNYMEKAAEGEYAIREVALHLGETPYMDSTFMGTLLLIDKACVRQTGSHLQIYNPSAFCRNLMESSGLADYLPLVTSVDIEEGERWPLEALEITRLQKARLLLKAHEELSALNEENRKQFSLIRKLLEQDIQSLGGEGDDESGL